MSYPQLTATLRHPFPSVSLSICLYTVIQTHFLAKSDFQCLLGFLLKGSFHWHKAEKDVHQFRFLLPTMRTPNSVVVCSCMYALLLKWDPMRTPPFTGVCIGSHLNRNTFVIEHTTIGIHEEEVPKLVYNLFCCKPVIWSFIKGCIYELSKSPMTHDTYQVSLIRPVQSTAFKFCPRLFFLFFIFFISVLQQTTVLAL